MRLKTLLMGPLLIIIGISNLVVGNSTTGIVMIAAGVVVTALVIAVPKLMNKNKQQN